MKKILFSLILLTFYCSPQAQVIYVDINNNTGTEDGTQEHPFNTIKEGINAAVPGDQVFIRQGTYTPDDSWSGNDHTLLLKAGVSLMGEGADKSIINGIVVDQESSNLSISLEKLKFDEFHFTRGTHEGPFSDLNIIRHCATTLISLPFGEGIPVNDTTPGTNYGFLIENNDLGMDGIIEFKQGEGVSEINVLNNTCGYIDIKSGGGYTYLIDNNDVQYGIFDKSTSNPTTISNNRIYNGTISDYSGGNNYGIEDEIIENNTVIADENSPVFIDEDYKAGITAKSRSATIRNNNITCTGHVSGIRSSAGAPLHIINNTITQDEVQQPEPDPYEGTSGIFNFSGWGYVTGNEIHGGNMGYYSKAGTAEFANNEIEKSYTGFYSLGAEVVHHNIIKNCYGDGMILDGLRGPVFRNEVTDNAGAGIRVTRMPIDLGGGADDGQGNNTITGNGNYDLYIETVNDQYPTIYARYNVWDHENPAEIAQLDIRDGNDSTGLVVVDFTPIGHLGIADQLLGCEVTIIPNPARETVEIRSAAGGKLSAVVEVLTLKGNKIMEAELAAGTDRINIDLSRFPSGAYFFRIVTDHYSIIKKVILTH